MSSRCPKCNEKIKATYLKPSCPNCGVNMLYYKMDERLEEDAKKAQSEVDAVNRFLDVIKASTIKTPWHIVRLVLFFTPLLSMCLPMYWAGHKNVSLITFIMSIINHGFDLSAMLNDKSYLFAVLSIVLVIVISIGEIISSLFSSKPKGLKVAVGFYAVNLLALLGTGFMCFENGGSVKAGFIVTLIIYLVKFLLHNIVGNTAVKKSLISLLALFVACGIITSFGFNRSESTICLALNDADVSVVSFNVASAFGTSLEDTDSMDRCARFEKYISEVSPTFIGTQEMNSYWMAELENNLTDYDSYAVKRGGDSEEKNSEMNAIFWDKSYTAVETNTIWLSQTPDEESKFTYTDEDGRPAEAGCNRICSYAVLYGVNKVILLNTHLDNSCEEARVFGANLILEKIEDLKSRYDCQNVILTGDFNEDVNSEAVQLLSSKLTNTNPNGDYGATYQEWGYRQTGGEPIDFIFTTMDKVDYCVLSNIDNGYVSDHYGIYAGVNF